MEELRKAKAQCLEDITRNLHNYEVQLVNVDERLLYYIQDAVSNDGSHANIYELLGIRTERQFATHGVCEGRHGI